MSSLSPRVRKAALGGGIQRIHAATQIMEARVNYLLRYDVNAYRKIPSWIAASIKRATLKRETSSSFAICIFVRWAMKWRLAVEAARTLCRWRRTIRDLSDFPIALRRGMSRGMLKREERRCSP